MIFVQPPVNGYRGRAALWASAPATGLWHTERVDGGASKGNSTVRRARLGGFGACKPGEDGQGGWAAHLKWRSAPPRIVP